MSIAALVDEIARLRAENAELRLILAAQQGKPEGAPSARWQWRGDCWQVGHDAAVQARAWPSGRLYMMCRPGRIDALTDHGTARAAMLYADNLQRKAP